MKRIELHSQTTEQPSRLEVLGMPGLRFVACNNPFIWQRLGHEKGRNEIEAIVGVASGVIDARENVLGTSNCLHVGDKIRLPQGFAFREPAYQCTVVFALDGEEPHLDFRVDYVDYHSYILRLLDPHAISTATDLALLNLHVPKYLVADPQGLGDFERMLDQLSLAQPNGIKDFSSLKQINWRSFVIPQ